jgi:hypothetical protein
VRQEAKPCTTRLDRGLDRRAFMGRQVVEDDGIAGPEGWGEHWLDLSRRTTPASAARRARWARSSSTGAEPATKVVVSQ